MLQFTINPIICQAPYVFLNPIHLKAIQYISNLLILLKIDSYEEDNSLRKSA